MKGVNLCHSLTLPLTPQSLGKLGNFSKPRRQRQRERGKKSFNEQDNGSARAL